MQRIVAGCGKVPRATVKGSVECFGLVRTDHSVWRGRVLMGVGVEWGAQFLCQASC